MSRKSGDTSFEKRQLVIWNSAKGLSGGKIAALLNMKRGTVNKIIRAFRNEDRIEKKPRSGRPGKLSPYDKRFIVRRIEKNPKISAEELSREVAERCHIKITGQAIRNFLVSTGYNSRTVRRKPYISAVNKAKRLAFAQKYGSMDEKFWSTVIFSDESKFNLFGHDGRQRVWRKRNTALDPKNVNLTVKHGGGHVMVWGCFAASGVGSLHFVDKTMTAADYVAILKANLRQSAEKLGLLRSYHFYQDNDPKHSAYITREWLLYNCRKTLDVPPQSPDLNPIENLWFKLEQEIRKRPVSSASEMKQRLLEEWQNLPPTYLHSLVASMPRRLAAVIKAQGGHTKY